MGGAIDERQSIIEMSMADGNSAKPLGQILRKCEIGRLCYLDCGQSIDSRHAAQVILSGRAMSMIDRTKLPRYGVLSSLLAVENMTWV